MITMTSLWLWMLHALVAAATVVVVGALAFAAMFFWQEWQVGREIDEERNS